MARRPVDDAARQQFRDLLAAVVPANPFYAAKFAGLKSLAFESLPFTTKAEIVADQAAHPPYGTNRTFPRERYARLHQTSGSTTGHPLRWLDTLDDWDAILGCWRTIFGMVGLTRRDVLVFPFSFGPFLGFWSAFEAASRAGYLSLPAGGMTTTARLRYLLEHAATVVFATPTYALHMAEVAGREGIDLPASPTRCLILAGEPGGSIPATRTMIETAWGARVFDHYGMTETGPVAVETLDAPGSLAVLAANYVAEVVEADGTPTPHGSAGELVLTTLTRPGAPLIRYRTGDLVRASGNVRFDGGILGRIDDMLHIRGNNLYPTAIEAIVRRFPAVAEFRIVVDRSEALADLHIDIEAAPGAEAESVAECVARALRDELLFRVEVRAVPAGSLPRYEMKARRVVQRT